MYGRGYVTATVVSAGKMSLTKVAANAGSGGSSSNSGRRSRKMVLRLQTNKDNVPTPSLLEMGTGVGPTAAIRRRGDNDELSYQIIISIWAGA